MDLKKNIIVIGAGYGGITAVLRLSQLLRRSDEYQIHLIDKNPYHTLKTQLHEAAIQKREVTIPIDRIIRRRKIIFHLGVVRQIDVQHRLVKIGSKEIPYSYLVFAIGSQANFYSIPGVEQFALPLQTVTDAEIIHKHISKLCALASSETTQDRRRELLRFIIGGGGLSGVEFAAELAEYVDECLSNYNIEPNDSEIIIVEAGDRILSSLEESFTTRINKKLSEKKIKIFVQTKIIEQTHDSVILSNGEVLSSKTLIWTGGIRIADLARESGFQLGSLGRIVVDEFLRAVNNPDIYAIGDNALAINPATNNPVPAAAQFALQQGRLVAQNIFSDIFHGEKKAYRPHVLGEVISLGNHLAVGWLALPFIKKITFVGFIGSLLKAAIQEKHVFLLRKESRNWITY